MHLIYAISIELTLAGLQTLNPPVIYVSVAGTSTLLKPSTTRSATTDSAGFLKCAALWARHRAINRWGDERHAGGGSGYEFPLDDRPM